VAAHVTTRRSGGPAPGTSATLAAHRRLMRFGEDESVVAPIWSEHGTSVRAVAGHLASLWTRPTDGDDPTVTEKGLAHGRASVLNLVVSVPGEAAADRVLRTMLALGYRHPSRALVLVADAGAPAGLDAAISAHCHARPGGDGEQVCYEEVVLSVRGEAAQHLSATVAPLLIHDLPTHVWWPGSPPFGDPIFDQLVELSDRLVVDSSDFGDLLIGFRHLTTLRRRSGIGDLAWERLEHWQELTAQFFDGPRFRRYLPNLNRLILRYAVPPVHRGPGRPRRTDRADAIPGAISPLAGPLLFAGWLAARLDWRRYRTVEPLTDGRFRLTLEGVHQMVELRLEPVETPDMAPGELVAIRLRCYGETGAGEFIIDRTGPDEATVVSNVDGMTALLRRVRMDPVGEAELLARSLITDRHDPVYEDALRAAAVFLASARPGSADAA